MKSLFVTGMFRSGTTLLAKMMDAHREVAFASDPYRPFFNHLRDAAAARAGLSEHIPVQSPLNAYFADEIQSRVRQAVQDFDLKNPISPDQREQLVSIMQKAGEPYAPKLTRRMGEIRGKDYRSLFESMLALVANIYGKAGARAVGFKEVWCTEFAGMLLHHFPEMKVILMVRDPRAVCASNHAKDEKYPWLFLTRQWRKLALFAWRFAQDPETKDRVFLLRYEDLIGKPEETSKRMCSFLDIDFDPVMTDGSCFRDGDGNPWTQNSSYGSGQGISTAYAEKWKSVLNPQEIRHIELLCDPDMKLFGYEPFSVDVDGLTDRDIEHPLMIPENQLAQWIRPFSDVRLESHQAALKLEAQRREWLVQAVEQNREIPLATQELYYLDPLCFRALCKQISLSLKG